MKKNNFFFEKKVKNADEMIFQRFMIFTSTTL